MKDSKLTTMRRAAGNRIGRMTQTQAAAWLDRYRVEGVTAIHATVRELTGGYSSQSICGMIHRHVARKAGKVCKI